jgi:hypothetical protein
VNRPSIPALEPEPQGVAPAAASAHGGAWAWLSLLVPLAFGIWSLRADPSWADDAAIVRDLGFVPMGFEGSVSTLATQLLALLPLGARFLRASLIGVLSLALASRLLFGVLNELLERRGSTPLNPALACFASSIWALAPAVQAEAGRAGGALPALALVLCTQRLAAAAFGRGESGLLAAAGLAWGATLAESQAAGACVGVWLLTLAIGAGRRRLARELWRLVATCAGVLALAASLRWLPSHAMVLPSSAALGSTGTGEVAAPVTLLELGRGVGAGWMHELGGVTLGLAAAGLLLTLGSRPLRRQASAWLSCALLQLLVVAWPGAGEPPPVLGILSTLGVSAFFPLGVQALVLWLWACRLPLSRPAAVLTVTFAATLVVSRADRTAATPFAPPSGVLAWTEAALGQLPPQSLVLVQSPELALRLLAARTLYGSRPDVMIVSSTLLSASALQSDTALTEPSLLPLLRELWVNGAADEYSLSRLADLRPVFTELDPAFDRRLLEHLRPDGVWLGVSAHALGPSERRAGAARSRGELHHLLELAGGITALDSTTRRQLADAVAGQALLFVQLGEREPAEQLLRAARRIDRDGPIGRALEARLAEPALGYVAARDRLR